MITINFNNILSSTIQNGLDEETLKNYKIKDTIEKIYNKSHDMMGWLDLPLTSKEIIIKIETLANYVKDNFDNFVVLGIGGSALSAKMLFSAFPKSKVNCFVYDNIDPDGFNTLLSSLDLSKTFFNVITKSGGTSETIATMKIVVQKLQEQNIPLEKNMAITTETNNSLYTYAKQNKIETLEVPKDVGGRFSIFSPVGLFPASVYGLDIRKMLMGAKSALLNGENEKTFENMSALFAIIAFEEMKQGKDEIVLMPYSTRLSLLPDFFCQLWAESLGKKLTLDGKNVEYFQTPIKAIGATDQHSLIQLFVEGKNNKLFNLIKVEYSEKDMTIPNANINIQNTLDNVSLSTLLNYELDATSYSLTIAQKPNITITLDTISEENIGRLIFMFELATAICGELLNINTFNQPGVENGKIFTKALLNKNDNDKKTEILNHIEKGKNKIVVLK